MHLDTFTLTFFIAGAQAIGRAIITNQCDTPVYVWSVGETVSQQYTLEKDQSYSETFQSDPGPVDTMFKISNVDGGIFVPNNSYTIFNYTLTGDRIEYDLSDVVPLYQYHPFLGKTVKVTPTDENCESIAWGNGGPPKEKQVESCAADTDLELSFCTGHCLPAWYPCGNNAPGETRQCCTHCIGSHHCVAATGTS